MELRCELRVAVQQQVAYRRTQKAIEHVGEDANGKVLAENDDISADDQNSRVIFSPKQAGVYCIIATSFQQQGTGAYTLTVREFAGPLGKTDGPPKSPEAGLAK